MLILPLHRAPTWKRFPWATLLLIVANVVVFAFFQSGDHRVRARAIDGYIAAGLDRIEFPAYAQWLREHDEADQAGAFDMLAQMDKATAAAMLQSDDAFVAALDAGSIVSVDADGHDGWKRDRAAFALQWNAVFTERWMIRFDRFDPPTLVTATFLHGSVGHLIGNMVFLALIGILVEGALGGGLFLALYLLAGIGASLTTVAYHWGDVGGGLGASGAIAGLMGAYCVLWGMRRVRFFWWFFVVFDYVKAPALVLLPFWLGWELFNLAVNGGANIGFDAHAGGIVSGALLAWLVRRCGWERRDYMDEDVRKEEREADAAALAQARECIGRLELARARALIEPLLARRPGAFEPLVLLYRCARYGKEPARLHQAAIAVLRVDPLDAGETREQKQIHRDYLDAVAGNERLPANLKLVLARRWLAIGEAADALQLAAGIIWTPSTAERLARESLSLAQAARASGYANEASVLLDKVIAELPQSVEAGKARILRGDGTD